jgi:hypothetical protein
MASDLSQVRRATARRKRSEQEWRDTIRAAVADGASLRKVAEAAGVTHVRVLHITREQ